MSTEPQVDLVALAQAAAAAARPKVIWTGTKYFNQDGLCIEQRAIISGDRPADFPEFVAFGTVILELEQGPGAPKQERKQPIAVGIEATTIQEAFEKAPALIEAEAEACKLNFTSHMDNVRKQILEKQQQEALRRKLLTPAGEITPGLKRVK